MRLVFKRFQKQTLMTPTWRFAVQFSKFEKQQPVKFDWLWLKKRVRQTINDDDDDDDRHYFRNVYTHMKMTTFVGVYSNTLEYCQSNSHESDRNDVSPRGFFKLMSEWVGFNVPPDTIYVISEANLYLCATFNIRNHVRVHSFGWCERTVKTCSL